MKQRSIYLAVVVVVCLAFIGVTVAQRPETNIDPSKHPNLAEAQHHILQAFEKIDEAQRDLDQAELNLRYCSIVSEIDGVVTRLNAAV